MHSTQTFADIDQTGSPGLFTSLVHAWGYSSLGNLEGQRLKIADEPTDDTQLQILARNAHTTPANRLVALKAARFTKADKAERIQRSLHALHQPLGINLSTVQWAEVAKLAEEDEE